MPRVYLAGPIKGCEYGEAVNWRENVAALLAPEIAAFSPMRGKAELATHAGPLGAEYGDEAGWLVSPRAIFARDYADCARADLVLAFLTGATAVSIGTMFELAWCHAHRIPLVVVDAGTTNTHRHPFVEQAADWIVPSLVDAVYVARSVLLP